MNKTHRKIISSLMALCIAGMACNLPNSASTNPPANGEATATFTPAPAVVSDTPVASATACSPIITTNTDSNVRTGPGQVYNVLGQIPQGGTAPVAGKNAEGTWWYIQFPAGPGGYGWIAGSITTATCIPDTLPVIAAPPTPIPPTSTNTPTATATSSGGIIIFPPIILLPSSTPTPTLNISFPTISIPCIFCP